MTVGLEWSVHGEQVPGRGARRPDDKARRPRIPGVFEEEAMQSAGMPRPRSGLDQRGQATSRKIQPDALEPVCQPGPCAIDVDVGWPLLEVVPDLEADKWREPEVCAK